MRSAAVMDCMGTREQRSRFGSFAAGLLLALAIAGADVATGYEINLGLFYLAPIALVTWFVGRAAGIGVAAACVVGMFVVDNYVTRDMPFPTHNLVPYWNAMIRLGYFVVFACILSALKKAHEREKAFARQDFLTGVANGQAFFELLSFEIAGAQRSCRPFSVAYVDCDNFKEVNDRFGHATGDEVLRVTAATMARNLRKADVVARLGGDEFALLLGDAGPLDARERIETLHAALIDAARRRDWPVTYSIGVATFLKSPPDAEIATREADRLMYTVKNRGKNGVAHGILEYPTMGAPFRPAIGSRGRRESRGRTGGAP